MTTRHAVDFSGAVQEVKDNTDDRVDVESQNTQTEESSSKDEPTKTIVTNLDVYQGSNLQEQIDSVIKSHPVVMLTKTWCLFSVDAQQFLLHQLRVSIHVIEADTHPQGTEILKHVTEKTGHKTVPIIFIKGEFLGGFEDVNTMYATGQLEEEYLEGLTQADRCEAYLSKADVSSKPLFWFPETVNAHVVRFTGILTCLISLVSATMVFWFDWGAYLTYALFFDFILRLLAGAKISPVGRLATLLTLPFEPKLRSGRPKQFATMCGVMFATLGSVFYFVEFPYHKVVGTVFVGGLAIATGMEGFLDFCVGCVMFKIGIQWGLIKPA